MNYTDALRKTEELEALIQDGSIAEETAFQVLCLLHGVSYVEAIADLECHDIWALLGYLHYQESLETVASLGQC